MWILALGFGYASAQPTEDNAHCERSIANTAVPSPLSRTCRIFFSPSASATDCLSLAEVNTTAPFVFSREKCHDARRKSSALSVERAFSHSARISRVPSGDANTMLL